MIAYTRTNHTPTEEIIVVRNLTDPGIIEVRSLDFMLQLLMTEPEAEALAERLLALLTITEEGKP
jgi:hypothetical protein